jgi:hypothetical protein
VLIAESELGVNAELKDLIERLDRDRPPSGYERLL